MEAGGVDFERRRLASLMNLPEAEAAGTAALRKSTISNRLSYFAETFTDARVVSQSILSVHPLPDLS